MIAPLLTLRADCTMGRVTNTTEAEASVVYVAAILYDVAGEPMGIEAASLSSP